MSLSKNFFDFLNKIKFSNSANPGDDFEEIKSHDIAGDNGRIVQPVYANVKIIFPLGTDDYTKRDFVEEGLKFLEENMLLSSPKIFYSILVGFDFYKRHPSNAIKNIQSKFIGFFNQLKKKCYVSQFYIFKQIQNSNSIPPFYLDSYVIGTLNYSKFYALIEDETASDFHHRLSRDFGVKPENQLHLFNFEKQGQQIFVIDFVYLVLNKIVDKNTFNALNNLFFEAYSIELTRKFWLQFDEEQKVSVACGVPYFNPERFRFSQLDQGVMVSVFFKINNEKRGWVIPMENSLTRLDLRFQFGIEHTHEITKKIYSGLKFDSDFSGILNQLVNFLSKGNFELGEQKFSEALLNYWVALDTILNNTEEGNSNSLKNRVAALLWYSDKSSHKSMYYKVSESYTKRSKYVHAGESASESDAVFLRKSCQSILDILINVHNRAQIDEKLTYSLWIDQIDELANIGRNNPDDSRDLLVKIGIIEE